MPAGTSTGNQYRLTPSNAVSTMAPVDDDGLFLLSAEKMALRSFLVLLSGLLLLSTACLAPASTTEPAEASPTPIRAPAPTEAPPLNLTVIPSPEEERQDTDCPCEVDDTFHRHQRVL